MDSENACSNCGALYKDQESLSVHMEKCEEDSDEEYDDSIWIKMVQEVYDDNNESYQEIKQQYKDEGMEPDEAERKATEDMHSKYKKDLRASYKRLLTYMNAMENSSYHKKFMDDIDEFEEDSYGNAVKMALKKNDGLFDDILDTFDAGSSAESSDESSDDSSDESEETNEDEK